MAFLKNDMAIAGLYVSLLGRAPEADGFTFWLQALNNGVSLETVAQAMHRAPEVAGAQPTTQTDAQFIASFYTNVLGRTPDAGGMTYWSAVLQTLGGVQNAQARAALVLQIADVLSTPLATRPSGLSDSDYQRALADRAVFTNKVEFGVFFATELKSNDLALAKAALALITSDPTSIKAASNLAQGIAQPEPPVVTPEVPPLAITAADSASVITTKFAVYPGTVATVDASGMAADQLEAVSAAVSKITVVRNLTLALANVSDTATVNLLSKAPAGSAVADAGGASALELTALAANVAKLADNGVTGALALSSTQTAGELGHLLGIKTADAATVTVDASGMSADQLAAVNHGIGKVDRIDRLSLVLADMADAATDNLLGKAVNGSATVVTRNASATALSSLATHIAGIAANGITGSLDLSSQQTATELAALLSAKTGDTTATVTVDAASMGADQLIAVGGGIAKVDTLINVSLTLADLPDSTTEVLLAKATGNVSVIATGASKDELSSLVTHIDKIAANGINGRLVLSNDQTVEQLQVLLGAKTNSATALVTIDASGMSMAKLEAVAASVDKVGSLLNLPQLVLTGLTDPAISALLGKAPPESVSILVTGANNLTLNAVRANFGKIAPDGITGELTLSTLDSPANLTNWFTKASLAATVTFDASGTAFYGEYLPVVATYVSKVDHIINLSFRLATFSAETVGAFLARSATGSVQVDALGAQDDHWAALVTHLDKISATGLSGRMSLPSSLSADDLALLLGKITTSAIVTVDAAAMTMAQLEAVGLNIAKVDTLTNLPQLNLGALSDTATAALLAAAPSAQPLTVVASGASNNELSSLSTYIDKVNTVTGLSFSLQNVSDTMTSALLSKASANSARVDVTGASATEVTTVLGSLDKIVDRGLSGPLQVAYASLNPGVNATLSSKMDQASPVKVMGTNAKEVMTFPGLAAALIIDPAGGGDVINLGSSSATILIADRASTRNSQLSINDTTTDNLLHVESTGAVVMRYSTAAGAFGDGLTFTPSTHIASYGVWVDGADRTHTTLGDVIAHANSAFSTPPQASTNTDAFFYTFEIRGGNGLQGRFLFLNNQDATLTIDDLVMTSVIGIAASSFIAF